MSKAVLRPMGATAADARPSGTTHRSPLRAVRRTLPRRSALRAGLVALSASTLAVATITGAAGQAAAIPAALPAATGHVYYISPGSYAQQRMAAAMAKLRPGDTLKINPGTYGLDLRPDLRLARGTRSQRIVVTAADPNRPPLLLGAVKLDQPDWWILSHIRIQGNIANRDSLTINSGTGWVASSLEVFGARQTGAYANVVITKYQGYPTPNRFIFVYSCVHDAGHTAARQGQQHDIYVNAVGNTGNALIARNILTGATYGAAIKLGDGGAYNAPGPDNIQVANNTMFYNGEQILLHGRSTGHTIRGNLLVGSTRTLTNGYDTIGIYLSGLTNGASGTRPILVEQNYFSNLTRPLYNQGSQYGTVREAGDDHLYRGPGFASGGCGGLRPTDAHAKYYGRYAQRSLYTVPS